MNIVCINKCYNANNMEYILNEMYQYYEKDYLDLGLKYYHIYMNGVKIGYGTKEFIDVNFVTMYDYSRLIKEVDLIFEKYFCGKKIFNY